MDWILEHWATILGVIVAVHAVALAIVNVTPTPKDNEVLGKIYPWVEKAAGVITDLAKQRAGEPLPVK